MRNRWCRRIIRSLFWLCSINALIALPIAYFSIGLVSDVNEYFEYGWCDFNMTAEECNESVTAWTIFSHNYMVVTLCFITFSLIPLAVYNVILLIADYSLSRKNK